MKTFVTVGICHVFSIRFRFRRSIDSGKYFFQQFNNRCGGHLYGPYDSYEAAFAAASEYVKNAK